MLAGSEKVTTFASAFKKNGCSYKDWKFTIKELKALCKRDFPKRKVLEKDFWKKICRIKKDDLSLQSFRTTKCETFSNWFFELLVIFWEKRNVVFICQIPLRKLSSQDSNKTLFFIQWRVWSWLRMNASGRLNTCKSRGSIMDSNIYGGDRRTGA